MQPDQDIQDLIKKFSEHYHDAWASRKLESGWTYGETYSIDQRLHPRLKPFSMLSDYVSSLLTHSCAESEAVETRHASLCFLMEMCNVVSCVTGRVWYICEKKISNITIMNETTVCNKSGCGATGA